MSLQVTRRTWAISLPAVYAWPQGLGWQVMARNQSAAVCPQGAARDGRYAPCSPSSSKIPGVGGSASAGHLSSVTLDPERTAKAPQDLLLCLVRSPPHW